MSILTQSSLSPSSLDFEISSYTSSGIPTPVPNERMSPCGQDGEEKFQSPSSAKVKEEDIDNEMKDREMSVAYRGKNKLKLVSCLPFRKKKKNIKSNKNKSEDSLEDSYGANC